MKHSTPASRAGESAAKKASNLTSNAKYRKRNSSTPLNVEPDHSKSGPAQGEYDPRDLSSPKVATTQSRPLNTTSRDHAQTPRTFSATTRDNVRKLQSLHIRSISIASCESFESAFSGPHDRCYELYSTNSHVQPLTAENNHDTAAEKLRFEADQLIKEKGELEKKAEALENRVDAVEQDRKAAAERHQLHIDELSAEKRDLELKFCDLQAQISLAKMSSAHAETLAEINAALQLLSKRAADLDKFAELKIGFERDQELRQQKVQAVEERAEQLTKANAIYAEQVAKLEQTIERQAPLVEIGVSGRRVYWEQAKERRGYDGRWYQYRGAGVSEKGIFSTFKGKISRPDVAADTSLFLLGILHDPADEEMYREIYQVSAAHIDIQQQQLLLLATNPETLTEILTMNATLRDFGRYRADGSTRDFHDSDQFKQLERECKAAYAVRLARANLAEGDIAQSDIVRLKAIQEAFDNDPETEETMNALREIFERALKSFVRASGRQTRRGRADS
ncbi:uncharacterized protein L3040_007091 [Drepanopeziza brunnea f. sp. 'multigermtubi']|uniref:Uncharacterized protein n=1 Tax=Marssonina brunnea f. sp. multigermtubi (strain MB_m1) TaxID=1072389 RepID=K1WJI1_MARBU|nr:uncharacterized protein MBM_08773 [Drepanopeziza brunnea f. sp. 'multigermtubi' MB_m1]EKD13011.1 hypothetical protein MBM_08773 [Drepanopeziza brunnea f. sp. 'multigermtubi' MB_m1]KAJ5038224.1 hypothetical protein L3040_007091 [Drepanopeziza brunnea f. sp. 'multigermtubi']